MEKVLFVVRSLKEKLVRNLESLLLHGNEDFREQILKREEKRRKSQNKAHMARRGNPIYVRIWICFLVLSSLLILLAGVYALCPQFLERLLSMLLERGVRCLFRRLLGLEVPLFVFGIGCLMVGNNFFMMDPDRASASSGGSNSISVGEGGGSSRGSGWTSFDLTVLGEPFPNEQNEEVSQPNTQNTPANQVAPPGGAQEQEAIPQAPAPAEESHSAEVSELKRELHALITEKVREESEKGIGPLTTLFPEQRTLNSEVARHIIDSLELSSENDPDNIREWIQNLKQQKTILKDLIREYLPPKKKGG